MGMHLRNLFPSSSSLLIFLVMFILLQNPSVKGSFSNISENAMHSLHNTAALVDGGGGGVVGYKRKLLVSMDAMLDYDYAGANPKHEPRGKRSGGGGNGGGKN